MQNDNLLRCAVRPEGGANKSINLKKRNGILERIGQF